MTVDKTNIVPALMKHINKLQWNRNKLNNDIKLELMRSVIKESAKFYVGRLRKPNLQLQLSGCL